MSISSSSSEKFIPFRYFSKKEWSDAAKLELEGAEPIEKLGVRLDDVEIFPYYDQTDWPSHDYQLPPSQNEFLGPRSWLNVPRISVTDEKKANARALEWLNSGADGVLFDLQSATNPAILLSKIELPYCSLVFMTDSGQQNFFYEMAELAKEKKSDRPLAPGAIFWQTPVSGPSGFVKHFKGWDSFRSLGLVAKKFPSPIDEIAELLARATSQVEQFDQSEIKSALNAVAFSVSVGNDFFLEIAKLKTLRFLWLQIARAFDPGFDSPLFVHANIDPDKTLNYEPHGTMLKGTTAAMSAIFGGCDALTLTPADPDNAMQTRVARNVSSILREESNLGKVSDPTAGSFYLESLRDQLASLAWRKFQLIKS